jgi:BirA family transcriptional regulator, biotin operon repressor / biotin---[acetyl-CoA-carboxylase] ligase
VSSLRFGRIEWFDSIDSTNRYVADAAANGEPEGLVAIAGEQTAGRGRLDRSWIAPPGSALLCSVLVRPKLAASQWPLLTIAMALAAQDAIRHPLAVGPLRDRVVLKWPNDLMVTDVELPIPNEPSVSLKKLGGILAQAVVPSAVVVGIGVNVQRPDAIDAEVAGKAVWISDFHEGPGPITIPALADSLLAAFAERVEQLEMDYKALLHDYRERCVTLGATVQVTLPSTAAAANPSQSPMPRILLGRAVEIDDAGQLVVMPATGTAPITISVGDVIHVRSV